MEKHNNVPQITQITWWGWTSNADRVTPRAWPYPQGLPYITAFSVSASQWQDRCLDCEGKG